MALGRRPLTVTRKTGQFVAGVWTETGSSSGTISASVQPLNGLDLQSLPEGRRQGASFKLYTNGEIANGDRIEINGVTCEVIGIWPFSGGIRPHTKAIVVKKGA